MHVVADRVAAIEWLPSLPDNTPSSVGNSRYQPARALSHELRPFLDGERIRARAKIFAPFVRGDSPASK